MSTNDFQQMLDTDPLIEAEKITGHDYKEAPETLRLGMAMAFQHNYVLETELSLRDDTHYGTPFADTLRIYRDLGFEIVAGHRFAGTSGTDDLDRFIVLWRPDGILAVAESFGQGTNNSKLYYNWEPNEDVDCWGFTSSGGFHTPSYDQGRKVWIGHHDVRQALRHTLARLEANGRFIAPWIGRPFLWLLDYTQSKVPGYDHKAITAGVVAELPEYIRTAITPGSEP